MIDEISLDRLSAFKVGNAQNIDAGTGVTVIIAPDGASCGVDVRGGGPATRETDLLRPENMVQQAYAVMLAGGSAFGLAAADGVMRALEQAHIGLPIFGAHVPIVPSACLFDLNVGDPHVRPDADMGAAAVASALAGDPVEEGCVGAGTGATVGKILGFDRAMKSGLGICAMGMGPVFVAAIVAVNAAGSVYQDGKVIAGPRGGNGEPLGAIDGLEAFLSSQPAPERTTTANTTIGCILTDAALDKSQATKVAQMAHDGYARAIDPVHTPSDGDTVFCMSSGSFELSRAVDTVGIVAAEAMQRAIVRGVRSAHDAYGLPACRR